MKSNPRNLLLSLVPVILFAPGLQAADRSELALSFGGGALSVDSGTKATPVISLSYLYHITSHVAVEGSYDIFFHRFLTGPLDAPYEYWDGYEGVEAALVCHLRKWQETGRWIPFLAAGIGKTTTDFTEIRASRYYRLGAGVSYHFTEKFGTRIEVRDEIIDDLYSARRPGANLPSVRAGLVYRF